MSKVIVAIQARMGSQRLPGKVLIYLHGKPMLRRVWDACEGNWERVVLTSLKEENDILCDYMDEAGMSYARGSEQDVLSRYINLLVSEPDDTILVRVCGDAPFIKSDWIESAIGIGGCVVDGVLHCGTKATWMNAYRQRTQEDEEHAGFYWFDRMVPHIKLAPEDYMTVNTWEELEEAVRRLSGNS